MYRTSLLQILQGRLESSDNSQLQTQGSRVLIRLGSACVRTSCTHIHPHSQRRPCFLCFKKKQKTKNKNKKQRTPLSKQTIKEITFTVSTLNETLHTSFKSTYDSFVLLTHTLLLRNYTKENRQIKKTFILKQKQLFLHFVSQL